MKTPEEIKKALRMCVQIGGDCEGCPYDHDGCMDDRDKHDALEYIQQLEAKVALMAKYAPPVMPGTPIFFVTYNEDNDRCIVMESKVVEIWYNLNGWFFLEEGHRGPAHHQKHIGKSVFLDRETAQHKCDACNEVHEKVVTENGRTEICY